MAKTIHLHIHGRARVSTSDSGDWDEAKHKRDKGGQFSSTGGGGGAAKAAPIKHSTGTGQSFLPKQSSIAQGSVIKTGSGFTAKSPTGMKEFFKPGEEAKAKAWSEGKSHAEIAKMGEAPSAPAASEADIRKKYAGLSPEQLSSTRGANKTEQRIINKMAVENVKPAANAVPGQRGLPPAAAGWQGKPMTATQSVTAPGGSAPTPPMKRVNDPDVGRHTQVTLPNGKTGRIQKLNSTESMGLPGWHDLDAPGGRSSYLADTEEGAAKILAEKAKGQTAPPKSPQEVYAGHRKEAGAKGQAALDLVAKAKTSTDPKVVQEALTMVEAAWQAHKSAGEAFSKIPYPGANDAGAHHAERTQAYSKLAESMHQRLNALTNPAKSKGVSQARVDTTKGNHKPGWMLRADPELAAKFKAAEARQAERKAIK